MRKTFRTIVMSAIALFVFTACSKSDDKEVRNFNIPAEAKAIASDEILTELTKHGMVINEGMNPPDLQGIFSVTELELKYKSPNDSGYYIGYILLDYKYKFYEQNGINIKVDYKNGTLSDKGIGKGAIISGSNNKFTVFILTDTEHNLSTSKQIGIYSGEITPDGIKNFSYGFYMKEKNDPYGELMEVGNSRIWADADNISEKVNTY